MVLPSLSSFLVFALTSILHSTGVRHLTQAFLRTCLPFAGPASDGERSSTFRRPRRTRHVSPMGPCPRLACLWGQCHSRALVLECMRGVE
jgi:hypothetical protein